MIEASDPHLAPSAPSNRAPDNRRIAMPWEAAIRSRAMLAATKRFGVLWPRGAMPSVAIPAGQPAAQGTVPIHRPMLGNALTVAFLSGGMFSYAASPLILMQALGAGPAGSAGLLALSASGLLAGSLASSRLARTLDRRRIVIGGLVLSAVAGLALLGLAAAGLAQLAAVAILMAVYTFARSLVVPLATAAAMAPMGDAAGTAFGL